MHRPASTATERTARQKPFAVVFVLLLASMLLVSLAGCSSTGAPTAQERGAVASGGKAVVLLRVRCTVENDQPYEPFSHVIGDDNVGFGWGSFETGGVPERGATPRFLSPQSRKDGWTYFVLPSGTHYLAVYPPRRTDVLTYARQIRNAPRWRLDIGLDDRLVYAGTLRIAGESDALLFGGRILRSIRTDEATVVNEEALARALLAEALPPFGEARTALLAPQRGPTILHAPLPSQTR